MQVAVSDKAQTEKEGKVEKEQFHYTDKRKKSMRNFRADVDLAETNHKDEGPFLSVNILHGQGIAQVAREEIAKRLGEDAVEGFTLGLGYQERWILTPSEEGNLPQLTQHRTVEAFLGSAAGSALRKKGPRFSRRGRAWYWVSAQEAAMLAKEAEAGTTLERPEGLTPVWNWDDKAVKEMLDLSGGFGKNLTSENAKTLAEELASGDVSLVASTSSTEGAQPPCVREEVRLRLLSGVPHRCLVEVQQKAPGADGIPKQRCVLPSTTKKGQDEDVLDCARRLLRHCKVPTGAAHAILPETPQRSADKGAFSADGKIKREIWRYTVDVTIDNPAALTELSIPR